MTFLSHCMWIRHVYMIMIKKTSHQNVNELMTMPPHCCSLLLLYLCRSRFLCACLSFAHSLSLVFLLWCMPDVSSDIICIRFISFSFIGTMHTHTHTLHHYCTVHLGSRMKKFQLNSQNKKFCASFVFHSFIHCSCQRNHVLMIWNSLNFQFPTKCHYRCQR